MVQVLPFDAIGYAGTTDLSDVIAPPYDVLDATARDGLLARSARNIVAIDLPHIPPKQLGPPECYQQAAHTYRQWLDDGTLARPDAPVMAAYRQTFDFDGTTHKRMGMFCSVETVAFGPRDGGGILPHEETFSGPKADRLALVRATRTQLSPIFGLHQDEAGAAVRVLSTVTSSRPADRVGTTPDGVTHELWIVDDEQTIRAYADALVGEDIFVADGHHRYNTALNYLAELESDGDVPPDHPARQCMMVLASMSDPGLVIGPTHRVLSGMRDYTWDAFTKAAEPHLDMRPVGGGIRAIEAALEAGLGDATNALGLYDFATGTCVIATPRNPDPLAKAHADRSADWRTLDVAIVQELIVGTICAPALNNGQDVTWAFPHSIDEVLDIGAGKELGSGGGSGFQPQLAVIVRPTPLEGVRAVSRAGELMPQKSTFFYPKLATGLFVHELA